MSPLYRFGSFVLDTRKRTLSRNGSPVPLTPKAFDVLVVMAQNPHRVLTKEELLRAVWTDAFVEEGNLTQNVSLLRKALADRSGDGRLIVTVARRGYQFTADVTAELPEAVAVTEPASQPVAEAAAEAASEAAAEAAAPEPPRVASSARLSRSRGRAAALVGALAIVVAAGAYLAWRLLREAPPTRPERIMLAVLPFQNLTGDPSQEYLADGLTEELISRLARMHPERLGVIARTSAMAYKHTDKRLDQIARELSVQYALESSFRRGADRMRITVKLVRTADQSHLWSQDYDRPLEDILAVQADVAMAVAREVELRLTPQQRADLSRHRTIDPAVHEAFLKGRFLWNQRTEQSFRTAIEHFQAAIAKAPEYAEAHAGLADTYLLLGGYGFEAQEVAMPKAKASARRAIELDGRLAEPYTTLGLISLQYEWNWAESKRNFERALELNPNYAVAHHFYGDGYLTMAGRTDEAIAELRVAHELDPRSPTIATDLGKQLVMSGRHEEGMAQFRSVLETSPDFMQARCEMARALRSKGAYDEALAELAKVQRDDHLPLVLGERGLIFALQGRRQDALHAVDQLLRLSQRRHIDPRRVAFIHFALGDRDAAFAALEKAYQDHAHEMVMLKGDPVFPPIRSDPRYIELTRRLGLP